MNSGYQFSLLSALVLLPLLHACGSGDKVDEPIVRPVRYTEAAMRGAAEARVFSGTTHAEVESTLSFKVAGTVTQMAVNVGDIVIAGQLVAQLDPTDYRVVLQEAEAGLAAAQAEFRNSESNYNRVRDLYENRNASTGDLDAARAAWESAAAQVRATRQRKEGARLQLSYTRLTAPQECSIAETYVKENENVATGQSVARVNCGQCSEVAVTVPETFIGRVYPGMEVGVAVNAFSDQALPAAVTEVGVASGTTGTAFPVTVILTGECPELRSGMAADVSFVFEPDVDRPMLIVPGLSVGEDRIGRFVYVLKESADGIWVTTRREVEIGEVRSDGIEIVQGLREGELIVTAGVRRVIDGQKVRLLDKPGD